MKMVGDEEKCQLCSMGTCNCNKVGPTDGLFEQLREILGTMRKLNADTAVFEFQGYKMKIALTKEKAKEKK